MVARKESLKNEINELKELIDLYIKSNPNYHRKGQEEVKVEEKPVPVANVAADFESAFRSFANVLLLNQFN